MVHHSAVRRQHVVSDAAESHGMPADDTCLPSFKRRHMNGRVPPRLRLPMGIRHVIPYTRPPVSSSLSGKPIRSAVRTGPRQDRTRTAFSTELHPCGGAHLGLRFFQTVGRRPNLTIIARSASKTPLTSFKLLRVSWVQVGNFKRQDRKEIRSVIITRGSSDWMLDPILRAIHGNGRVEVVNTRDQLIG